VNDFLFVIIELFSLALLSRRYRWKSVYEREATAMRCQQGALVLTYWTITPGIMK